jgi:hypothetical protein
MSTPAPFPSALGASPSDFGGVAGAFCSGAGAGFFVLAGKNGDHVVDGHVGRPFRHHDFRNRPLVDRLDLHRRLVGLDLGEHIAGGDLVAFLH